MTRFFERFIGFAGSAVTLWLMFSSNADSEWVPYVVTLLFLVTALVLFLVLRRERAEQIESQQVIESLRGIRRRILSELRSRRQTREELASALRLAKIPIVEAELGEVLSELEADGAIHALGGKYSLRKLGLDEEGAVTNLRLFRYEGLYPICLNNGKPNLDSAKLKAAIKFLLGHHDPRAASDLVYLVEENKQAGSTRMLAEGAQTDYHNLRTAYGLLDLDSPRAQTDRLLSNIVRVVEDLGDTFKDVGIEFVLHDVRNPIKSVVAYRNTHEVSERDLQDPSTKFVVSYLHNQGGELEALRNERHTSYEKLIRQKHTRRRVTVKATTIPIFSEDDGLIGLLCVNVLKPSETFTASAALDWAQRLFHSPNPTPKYELDAERDDEERHQAPMGY